MARRRFFVEKLEGGRAVVRGAPAHHLSHVLRVRPGHLFEISDGERVGLGRVAKVAASTVEFAIEEELTAGPPLPRVTLLAAIFKFDRLEWVVEKATELGATRFVPVVARRTEAALARSAAKRVERWRRIAFEAAQQSRRLAPLDVAGPEPFDSALREAPAGRRWILDESPDAIPQKALLQPVAETVLLVGPEGGWTEEERRQAHESGFVSLGLGPLILRAETAAVAALAVVMYVSAAGTAPQCPSTVTTIEL